MSKPKVFISHSPEDQDWVNSFAQALRGEGAAVWLDQWELRAGDPRRDALERGLRGSDIVACVLTPENSQRPTLLFELGAAVGMGKRVVPIIPRNFDPSTLPFSFRVRQALQRTSPEETARRLLAEPAA
jgi:hypothetical protein